MNVKSLTFRVKSAYWPAYTRQDRTSIGVMSGTSSNMGTSFCTFLNIAQLLNYTWFNYIDVTILLFCCVSNICLVYDCYCLFVFAAVVLLFVIVIIFCSVVDSFLNMFFFVVVVGCKREAVLYVLLGVVSDIFLDFDSNVVLMQSFLSLMSLE